MYLSKLKDWENEHRLLIMMLFIGFGWITIYTLFMFLIMMLEK